LKKAKTKQQQLQQRRKQSTAQHSTAGREQNTQGTHPLGWLVGRLVLALFWFLSRATKHEKIPTTPWYLFVFRFRLRYLGLAPPLPFFLWSCPPLFPAVFF
jgi:hypothetical protein